MNKCWDNYRLATTHDVVHHGVQGILEVHNQDGVGGRVLEGFRQLMESP